MTELERKALLGDQEAQKECTEKGIVLPCSFCGKKAEAFKWGASFEIEIVCQNKKCNAKKSGVASKRVKECDKDTYERAFQSALSKWNTRQAPPIGRCGTCKWFGAVLRSGNHTCKNYEMPHCKEYDYCSHYEPREEK